jgi:hypothetical protein
MAFLNLLSHLKSKHPEYTDIYDVQNKNDDEGNLTLEKTWFNTEDFFPLFSLALKFRLSER